MARYEYLPIFKQMLELTVHIEKAICLFPRYHRYTLGSELRRFCHHALGLIAEANPPGSAACCSLSCATPWSG